MKPGDLLEYRCPRFGIVWQWRVQSVCLGTVHEESLIELSSVHLLPGKGTRNTTHETMWVPEPMTRGLSLIEREE